jgi:hypothetical protein
MRVVLRRLWPVTVVLVAAGCSATPDPPLLGHREAGPDPFLVIERAEPAGELDPVFDEASEAADAAEEALRDGEGESPTIGEVLGARLDAISEALSGQGVGYIRPRSTAGAAVLPGNDVCALDEMIERFATESDTAGAFAAVNGIASSGVADYLRSLTAGYLLDDTKVVNYGYRDGFAHRYTTVLQAGTAVLVDEDGLPRVRCRSANPLLPASSELDGAIVETSSFADRVVDAEIGPEVPSSIQNSVDGLFTDDPDQALGPPNGIAVAMGDDPESAADHCGYYVLLEMVDNRLVDGPGDDLEIVELGRSESTFVSIGVEPDELRYVGEIGGGATTLDIGAVTAPGEELAYVLLCDGPDSDSEVPGSDVDAVAALNSTPGPDG